MLVFLKLFFVFLCCCCVWITATACWPVFRSTWSDDCSQCWTRLRDWHVISVDPTTSPTRLYASTGCECRSEFCTRLPFSSTKLCTDLRRNTAVHSTMSPTCLAADLYVLLAPTVWQCRRLSWQPSPTEFFPVVGPRTGNDLPRDFSRIVIHLPSAI